VGLLLKADSKVWSASGNWSFVAMACSGVASAHIFFLLVLFVLAGVTNLSKLSRAAPENSKTPLCRRPAGRLPLGEAVNAVQPSELAKVMLDWLDETETPAGLLTAIGIPAGLLAADRLDKGLCDGTGLGTELVGAEASCSCTDARMMEARDASQAAPLSCSSSRGGDWALTSTNLQACMTQT